MREDRYNPPAEIDFLKEAPLLTLLLPWILSAD
jgi:hypothetical protein